MNISMKLVYKFMVIFLTFSLTSSLHSLQVENCECEDDTSKFSPERIESTLSCRLGSKYLKTGVLKC